MELKDLLKLINKKKQQCYTGRKLYYFKPEQQKKENDKWINGKLYTEKIENTQEVYTNWFKVLVNQKIDYSLSKPVTIDKNIPLEFNVEDILDKCVLNSSIDSMSWLQLIINDDGKFDWIVVFDNCIIPIFDKNNKYITSIIKFWEELENKDDEQSKKLLKVQIWDTMQVIEMLIKDEKIVSQTTQAHYLEKLKYRDIEEEVNPKGFGFIPFIPLYNNKNHESDSDSIDILLNVYNEISTGFINNVRKFQEMIMKLKGYGGQDLEEFEKILKKYRVIPVDENGDFDYLKVEIPVEARSTLLELCKKNIFSLGRGVDPTFDFGGSNITNVLIKSKFFYLDTKCSDMEKQIRLFYKKLILYINTYYGLNINNEIEFTRSQIFNESEQIDNCLKLTGIVSKETILKHIPWDIDINEELKLLEKEKQENIEEFNQQLEQNKQMDFNNNRQQ